LLAAFRPVRRSGGPAGRPLPVANKLLAQSLGDPRSFPLLGPRDARVAREPQFITTVRQVSGSGEVLSLIGP
jgi:hypothetical protein